MNNYLIFARKYRPKNFTELKGQEVLVKILTYAIINNRLAQSYLLTGIRGVGKTTSARIIAKTINCTNSEKINNNIKPCEACENCTSFNNQNHPDIIEYDAASRTGVDDVRRIIESCEYRPLLGKYKVFIIDEIHMLSKGAFNALLKILEEPPKHIIFIFATTEANKIPATVISRCQRYDLRRLNYNEIYDLLVQIVNLESIPYEPDALKIIAHKSEGSARDAISMLDQTASSSLTKITKDSVNKMLCLIDISATIEFVNLIANNKAEESVIYVNNLYNNSINLELFIISVSDFIAYLNKCKIIESYKNDIYINFDNEIKILLEKIDITELSLLWQLFSKSIVEIKNSHNQLIEVEMLIIKSIYMRLIDFSNDEKQIKQHEIIEYKFTDFLTYLYKSREMDLYYLLLNNAGIKKFCDNQMEIVASNFQNNIISELQDLLYKWSNIKWNVTFIKASPDITLKDQLLNKLQKSREWKILQEHFPESEISDILLKTN
jgi:DNA polymerase-3 subunit gamma/tau